MELPGKRIVFFLLLAAAGLPAVNCQVTNPYQKGITAEQNLRVISRLSPYSPGGVGFDSRYQGVRGSPFLFDDLFPSLVKIDSEEDYLRINADLDVYTNKVIFSHPVSGKLMAIPADIIEEVILTREGENIVFRTTRGKKIEPELDGIRFYQVVYSNGVTVIKVPVKEFTEADYQKVYSTDRRYDEFEPKTFYYYSGEDVVFRKILPGRKSLQMLFPGKKEIIESVVRAGGYTGNEELFNMVIRKIAASDKSVRKKQ